LRRRTLLISLSNSHSGRKTVAKSLIKYLALALKLALPLMHKWRIMLSKLSLRLAISLEIFMIKSSVVKTTNPKMLLLKLLKTLLNLLHW
jgi:hypothetical protein